MTNSITVYQTDADGIYTHPVQAYPFGNQPDTYNVPYGARLNAPPEVGEGQAALAVGDGWTVVADNRQTTLYRIDNAQQYAFGVVVQIDNNAVRYTGIGDVPDWLTEQVPPAPGATWQDGAWVAPPEPEGEGQEENDN